jgi:hypothetical protein
MRCQNPGHDHSIQDVKVAEWNRTEPHGTRPFHCPDCRHTKRPDHNRHNWVTYDSESGATTATLTL